MDTNFVWWRCVVMMVASVSATREPGSPHIVFIMPDDMGWNDVSYHGSDQIQTPNIDSMAYQAVIMHNYYSEAICTPARTALLTGKYPIRSGLQGPPLSNAEDRGIPLSEKLLPSYLKELGYETHLVGKWHVGLSRKELLPTSRGFDTHYGMRGGFVDYYSYNALQYGPNKSEYYGLDFYDDDTPQEYEERYVVDALTDRAVKIISEHNSSAPLFLHLAHNAPHAGNNGALLQPPFNGAPRGNRHIAEPNRRLYAEVVTHLDRCIGQVVGALAEKGILDDTIIVFATDNGAPTVGMYENWGVNWPLRGIKDTPWEGAVRVPAFIWHSSLKPRVWNGLMHITDLMPTLIYAAGGEVPTNIDGINQWPALVNGAASERKDVLVGIKDVYSTYAAYRSGDYKIIVGNATETKSGYYGEHLLGSKYPPPPYYPNLEACEATLALKSIGIHLQEDHVYATRNATLIKQIDRVRDVVPCVPKPHRGCLYNVRRDPTESHDLWDRATKIVRQLSSRLRIYWNLQRTRGPVILDSAANPANHGYTWVPWVEDTSVLDEYDTEVGLWTNGETEENIRTYFYSLDSRRSAKSESESNQTTYAFPISCEQSAETRNFLCILRNV